MPLTRRYKSVRGPRGGSTLLINTETALEAFQEWFEKWTYCDDKVKIKSFRMTDSGCGFELLLQEQEPPEPEAEDG